MALVVVIVTVTPMSNSSQTLILANQQGQSLCYIFSLGLLIILYKL